MLPSHMRPLMRVAILLAAATGLAAAETQADRVVIHKARRELLVMAQGKVIRSYRVALGTHPRGAKQRQGDGKTPEGIYTISGRNAQSQYHRALRVSYPNRQDLERARRAGVNPGGDIMIHGLPRGQGWIGKAHVLYDWTLGCIAVTDDEIEEIWRLVPNGTTVEITP